MRNLKTTWTPLLWMVLILVFVGGLVGCGVPPELTTADQALADARKAGKDKQCPDEFKSAEKAVNDAHTMCSTCYHKESVAKANQALGMINALCPARKVAVEVQPAKPPAPAPGPAPVPAPTVSLSASSASVAEGKCTNLTWSSANASSASIDPGIGRVNVNGTREVCPDRTTEYRITVTGDGGSRDASTTVAVNPRVVDRLALHVNFDFNKAVVRKADDAEMQKAIDFINKYPGSKIEVAGYTDNIGTQKYNQGLSERRAAAVKDYLVKHGIDGSRIQTSGHGESDPIADNSTEEGRFKNRRVEIQILSE
jgi:outer membrane protein OmpA-like peptidoglycan-associated protein